MSEAKRPEINTLESAKEFRRWYWLKEELISYCRLEGISYAGGKSEISDHIAHYLETVDVPTPSPRASGTPTSKFDWSKEPLMLDMVITDSYRNGPNMRAFMKKHVGQGFRFNIDFMNWMKHNSGKTLEDAVVAWHQLEERKKDKASKTKIPPHNEYNQYVRDFFADNPNGKMVEARACWQKKRSLPGSNKYEPSDLDLPNW